VTAPWEFVQESVEGPSIGLVAILAPAHFWLIEREILPDGRSAQRHLATLIAIKKSLKTKPKSLQGNPDHLRLMKQATVTLIL
jgi:hypothetical protein